MSCEASYNKLVEDFAGQKDISAGVLFGKKCLKVGSKAFVAFQDGAVVFKLDEKQRAAALAIGGSHLWDPSHKGRPMKEWVAVHEDNYEALRKFARAALRFVVDSQ